MTYLGLVLDLHLRSRQELGVDPLRHPSVNLLPWRPDRQTEVERPSNTEHNNPDDVPEVRVQEEQYQVHHVHNGKRERHLVRAQSVAKDPITAALHLCPGHDCNGATEGGRKEEVGFGELAAEDQKPQADGSNAG